MTEPTNLNVLLVEDERIIRFIITSFFRKCGCNIDEAVNGLKALELYKKKNYDIILMDVQMPLMDGIEAAKKIREFEKEHNFKSYIVGVSSEADRKEECLKSGMDIFYTKPLMVRDILEVIRKTKDPSP